MKGESVTGVQPGIFQWARTSVGLSIADVATMLKRRPEEVEAWETGNPALSRRGREKGGWRYGRSVWR